MKNVTIIGKLHPAGLEILHRHGGLILSEFADPAVPIPPEKISEAHGLLIRTGTLTEADIRGATQLQIVSRHGVGCDNIPVDALSARGIPVAIVGPVNAISVAEQTIAMLLSMAKRITPYDLAVRQGNWEFRNSLAATEVSGKTLLLLGLGRIGTEVAKRARAFNMSILVYDPFLSEETVGMAGATKVTDWKALLGTVDVLSIHLPLSEATRNIIDADVLAAMKPTAIVLNAARGGLIDEQALFAALSGRMMAGGAGLDVFDHEPPRPDNPLLSLPNVVLSPHSAAMTEESARRMSEVSALNIIAGLEGALDPALIFNRKALGQEA
ncbi:MAG: hydroxyacid dehydrogenase [Rhodobacteraceae bacterium]|nr:hydroxyacid dehydrogenase [Paracoccaceae bacterium]